MGVYLIDELGLPITSSNPLPTGATITVGALTSTAVVVAATSTTVLAANTDRKWALFINDSDETLYLRVGAASVLNSGIRLNANGGTFEMSSGIGNLNTGAVYAISTSGNKKLLVTEGV